MWTTIGHSWATDFLQKALANGRLGHAFLITGPAQVGKTHLALELAAAINCEAPSGIAGVPCGDCETCQRITGGTHPDISILTPEGTGHRLRIGQMRELQHELALTPFQARRRVAIVTDFQTATRESANALLKTLEEPPGHVALILTATDASDLLPTIVSRCQLVALRAVPTAEIADALTERYGIEPDRAHLVAAVSGGRVGWAIRVVQDDGLWQERNDRLAEMAELIAEGPAERILVAEKLAKRSDVRQLAGFWQGWWRDALLCKTGCEALVANTDQRASLESVASVCDLDVLHGTLRATERLYNQMDHNVNLRLALEVLLLGWPCVGALARPKS